MPRFKRLTEADLSTLTREELLDRFERENTYWDRMVSRGLNAADAEAHQEFSRLLHKAIDPGAGIQDAIDYIEGRENGNYWQQVPEGGSPMP